MSKAFQTIEKCPGCGSEIQHDKPGKPGFIPADVYERRLKEGKEILCQRCFKLKHYGMLVGEVDEDEIIDFLRKTVTKFNSFMYVLDIFDFEGTYRPEINEMIKDKNVIYVVNKFDILPKSVSGAQLKKWLADRINNANGDNIFITSTKNEFGISKLKKYLENLRGEMLVLGVTNVGKSSLLKKLTNSKVTVSPYPGTTIGIVKHKLKNLKVYDTPGIIVNDRMIDLFDADCQAKVLAKGEVNRKTFKPYPGEVIFIGGLCKISSKMKNEENLRPIFQIFAPENVSFHKTKNKNFIDNFPKYFGKELVPPCKKMDISGLNFKNLSIEVNEGFELSIPGLCWINIKRGPVQFDVYLPENVSVYIRPSLIQPKRKFKNS
ncbi:ribosome biogenesis GTPase YqeH [Fervidobacterium sp. 2310opik-2]|uniref:ribosome biogenesis GTPase YqeH n=1 Tax=Fervidobacterium sp. 2310opik-2 TaxID=1755815 RepID=UPI0013DF7012|nr:ribosome biogenesis GTPase YqeH [Fervidobacterium sp. 2310opik-2]KAF2962422.1 ribosome biogenesis GTPase YqeH [Fervidobacterium sp. 2310opik-2]